MKKILFIIALLLFPLASSAQKLEKNEVDEFTGNFVKRTSWEVLNGTMAFNAFYRINQINNNSTFEIRMIIGSGEVFSIKKDQEIMFKLSNGDFVKLACPETQVTCRGCGGVGIKNSSGYGIEICYPINKEELALLKNNKITKVRIYTDEGYVENEVKDKIAQNVSKAIALIEE